MWTTTPPLAPPGSIEEWEARRLTIRGKLFELLGDLPPRPKPEVKLVTVEERDYFHDHLNFDNGAGAQIWGHLLRPKIDGKKYPAILYNHWHGGEYQIGKQEVFLHKFPASDPRASSPALDLVRRGYVVLCIDAYCFGDRSGCGPCGPDERGREEEHSTAKYNLWIGRTLWGMILRDDLLALDYLCLRPEVDASRIGAMGLSMGATRTWWLMALDERIRVGMAALCLTRYQNLIAAGALNKHGIYYYVPGFLKHFDTEAVVALIAPRPILFQTGNCDPGSPLDGIREIERQCEPFWKLHNARENFQSRIYEKVAHDFTGEMWQRSLDWMDQHLGGAK